MFPLGIFRDCGLTFYRWEFARTVHVNGVDGSSFNVRAPEEGLCLSCQGQYDVFAIGMLSCRGNNECQSLEDDENCKIDIHL
jgi:hypothetical protein